MEDANISPLIYSVAEKRFLESSLITISINKLYHPKSKKTAQEIITENTATPNIAPILFGDSPFDR
ncbi:MAG: hypothetical protein WAO41_09615 [Candidatus Nanopelagicales bacterium]